jgi:DNA-binding LacI/PurR family transcriptional regulator
MGKRVTFRDVARSAQVSNATVSRVLRGGAKVSPDTAERVRKSALELGIEFRRKNLSKVIGFLLCNREMLHPFHSRLLSGAETYCTQHGCSVIYLRFVYAANAPWRSLHLPETLENQDLVNGFIVAGANTKNLFDMLSSKGVPFAVLGNNVIGRWQSQNHDCVWFDDTGGAYEMTRYLQSLGHKAIWYVGNCQLPWFARRFEGYRQAMLEAGLEPRAAETESERDQEVGYLAAKSLLNRGVPVTAIFAGGDPTAQGVYKALIDCGLRIPEDISVTGFDDIEAGTMHPRLTTVRAFADQVGKRLAEVLMRRIAEPGLPPQSLTIPTQLVRRQSCRTISISNAPEGTSVHSLSGA